MRAPSKVMVPALGFWLPAITANSVVLPAPLAPISPTRSPVSTDRSTPRTATTPPKRFSRFSIASSATV